jgi:hypothetical protein
VTYDVISSGTTSEMTQYLSGEKMRVDVNSQGMDVQTYLVNNEYTTCNKATGSWMCQKIEYAPSATDKAREDIKTNVETYDVQSTGTKVVAGVTTDCYRVTTKEGTVDYCYSPDYVPLYIKTTAGATASEMIAKSYLASVKLSDFNPPAEAGAAVNPQDYLNNLPQP